MDDTQTPPARPAEPTVDDLDESFVAEVASTDSEGPGGDELTDLSEADPADAPPLAETLARRLSDELDAVGGRQSPPEQLRAPIDNG